MFTAKTKQSICKFEKPTTSCFLLTESKDSQYI